MEKKENLKVTCDLSSKMWLNTEEACLYTTFGNDALRNAREMRKLAYYTTERRIAYKRTDLDAWVHSLEYHPLNGRVQNQIKKK